MTVMDTKQLTTDKPTETTDIIDINLHYLERTDNDLAYTQPTHKNRLTLFIQQIELALTVNDGYGIHTGIDLSQYLFNNNITLTLIHENISKYIRENCFCAKYFDYSVRVNFVNLTDGNDTAKAIKITFTIDIENDFGAIIPHEEVFYVGT